MSKNMSPAEDVLVSALETSVLTHLEDRIGHVDNYGKVYEIDVGRKVFVKFNDEERALRMFEGEKEALEAILKTQTVRAPESMDVLHQPNGGAMHVLEFVDIKELSSFEGKLGAQIARLHLHNNQLNALHIQQNGFVGRGNSNEFVEQYGFPCVTPVGSILQEYVTDRCNCWQDFFARMVEFRISMIEKESGERDLRPKWHFILNHLSPFFSDVTVFPSLLHGDLHRFNAGQTQEGPVIFDPGCIFGHSEYDLAVGVFFPGFDQSFYDAYFKVNPKSNEFEKRQKLYSISHLLNYWNHFGAKKKAITIKTMNDIISSFSNS